MFFVWTLSEFKLTFGSFGRFVLVPEGFIVDCNERCDMVVLSCLAALEWIRKVGNLIYKSVKLQARIRTEPNLHIYEA